jgi:hypothetical protein
MPCDRRRRMNELDTFYDEVSKVAYDLFDKRGMIHGHDMEDWLKSEMIVKKRYMDRSGQVTRIAGSPDGMKRAIKTK